MIKKCCWGKIVLLGIFVLSMTHLVAEEQEFYSTGETITNQWTEPTFESKPSLSYGAGYVEGYQRGYSTGYDEGYTKGSKNYAATQVLSNKSNTNTEYFQGINEGFQKGYNDGIERGQEDHERWVGRGAEPKGQKQVRVWTFQWGYYGAYWDLSGIRNASRG